MLKNWLNSHKAQTTMEDSAVNQLKFAGVPQTRQPISAVRGPKFTILWEHVEDILLFNKFFPTVDICLSCEDIAQQSCAMVCRWRIFAPCIFSEPCEHISHLHSKLALRSHHVWKYGRHSMVKSINLGPRNSEKIWGPTVSWMGHSQPACTINGYMGPANTRQQFFGPRNSIPPYFNHCRYPICDGWE